MLLLSKGPRSIDVISLMMIVSTTYALTCDEILDLPLDKKLSLQELQTIPPKEMAQCLAHLGREQLKNEEAEYIWSTIMEFFEGVSSVPDSVLTLLHWITVAVTPEHFSNMTLSNIEVIQNFGLNYNLNEAQIAALTERVREDFAGKEPEDYTYYDLTALRQILCGFNRSEIERIHPAAYREAALIISKLDRCNPAVMAGFATLAIQDEAFGSPATWSESTWEVVGNVGEFVKSDSARRPVVMTISPPNVNSTQ